MPYIIPRYPPRRPARRPARRLKHKPKRRNIKKSSQPSPPPEKQALLIGIEYRKDSRARLPGCHNDVATMKKWLSEVHGVKHFRVVMDDGRNVNPTKKNILNQLGQMLRSGSKNLYVSYSGHGASVYDRSRDERDRKDETLIPVDYRRKGVITDDTLNYYLRSYLSKDCNLFAVFDCCHSGTICDLPYVYQQATGERTELSAKLKEHNVVVLSACKDNQTAVSAFNLEGQNKWRGALTHAIAKLDRNNLATKEALIAQLDNRIRKDYRFSQISTLSYTKQNPDLSLL